MENPKSEFGIVENPKSEFGLALESAFGKQYDDPYKVLKKAVRAYLEDRSPENRDCLARLVYYNGWSNE